MIIRLGIFMLLCYIAVLMTFTTGVIVIEKRQAAQEFINVYGRFLR